MSTFPTMKNSLSPSASARSSVLPTQPQFLALALAASALGALSLPALAVAIIEDTAFSDGSMALSGPNLINGTVHTNANFTIDGGATVNGYVTAGGSITNDIGNPGFLNGGFMAGVGSKTYPSMATMLAAIGIPDHEIFGNKSFSGSETFSGVWLIHGNLDISGDASGNATFLAEGDIDISGDAYIMGVVLNASFPFGLALYSSGGYAKVSDAVVGGAVAGKTTVEISGSAQVPEPSSALLLSLGCLGAAILRKRQSA